MLNDNTNKRKFHHLSLTERQLIERWKDEGVSITQIAERLNRSRRTIQQELKKGLTWDIEVNSKGKVIRETKVYSADKGQEAYNRNRLRSKKPLKAESIPSFIEAAEELLRKGLAPDVTIGYLGSQGIVGVCTKTLYNYIDRCILGFRNIDLRRKVGLKERKVSKPKENKRLYGDSIESRPEDVNKRMVFGHWEIDTIYGPRKKGAVLLTLDERMTRFRIIVKIPSKTSKEVNKALRKIFSQYGKDMFKSITADNGSEFSKLIETGVQIYYTHPYSSCERGTNEKQNSMVRYFFPKSTRFDNVPEELIAKVMDWINNYPRQMFGYQTPRQVFDSQTINR